MKPDIEVPRPIMAFTRFASVLRANAFPVAPDQVQGWIEAIGLLGPKELSDIHRSAVAMLAIPPERRAEFDALFRAFFAGQTVSAPIEGDEEEDVEAHETTGDEIELEGSEEEQDTGAEASAQEQLSRREFAALTDDEALLQFARIARRRLPVRKAYRRRASRHGDRFDMRRAMRQAVRRDGEVFELPENRRKLRQRPIVLLIDVSGSMRDQSEYTFRFAHALSQAADKVEVFTIGTRLTRITKALEDQHVDRAIDRAASAVADFDGGTLIGEGLQALLSVPRFAARLRGALVLVLSDGLERGRPDAMINAVWRMSRMAWRIDWLSPLAGDPDYEPGTEGMKAIYRMIDNLADGSSIPAICEHLLNLNQYQRRAG